MKKVDLFVIGGGSGGVRAARKAAEQGATVVLAEAGKLGGTCVNLGCVPKKLLSYAASFGHHLADAPSYGWEIAGTPTFSWPTMRAAKDADIARLNAIYATNLDKAGVTVVHDRATLTGPNTVVAGDNTYTADTILLATGGQPALPPTEGFAEYASVSDDIFSLEQLPKRAVVAGAGYIAVEFACIFAGLGVETTLVHRGPTVLKKFDSSIQTALLAEMERGHVKLLLDTTITKLEKIDDELVLHFANGDSLTTDLVLSATGRVANTQDLGLETAGVEVQKNGDIHVDASYQTNVASIYAIGDIIGKGALTPLAIAQGMDFVAQKYGGYGPPINYDLVPTAVFTHPNVGTVGMTEQQAKAQFPDCEIKETSFTPMVHSLTESTEKTMMKLIFEHGDGKVLGAHMVGPDAGELMQGIAVALAKGATKYDFDAMVGIHPTAAEEFVSMR